MKEKCFPVRAHFFPDERYGVIDSPVESPMEELLAAENWLQSLGCPIVYGPLGPSTWYAYRATLGPFERPLFFGESNFNPQPWEHLGYTIAASYTSSLASNAEQIKASQKRSQELINLGWKLRNLSDIDVDQALQYCHDIAEKAFSKAFCYRKIALPEFVGIYKPLVQKLDPRLILFAQAPDNKLAGFCLSYPDVLNSHLRQFVLKSLAVDPAYGGQGVGACLVAEAHRKADEMGMNNGGIHALMWEGSYSRNISAYAGTVIRRYALYQKRLDAAQ